MENFIDACGTVHEPVSGTPRIISLVPSITELLFDLGLGANVVGRTAYCVHPKDRVRTARSVGGTKTVHLDRIRALKPTHIIVNIDETPREIAETLANEGYRLVVTHPIAVEDNIPLYRLMGCLFHRSAEADKLCRALEAALADLPRAENLPPRRVLYLIWKNPWMTVSRETYIARMLSLIAWQVLPESSDVRYPAIDLAPGILDETDFVLFSSEPFPFQERHLAEFAQAFPDHAAKARLVDGQLVSWYGSRAIAGVRYLAVLAKTAPGSQSLSNR